MPKFGDWTAGGNTKVSIADDVYAAIVEKVDLVKDKDQDGFTKPKVIVAFKLIGIYDDQGGEVVLNRKFGATFAMNPRNNNPSMLAKAVSALTGIGATASAALSEVDPQDLLGKRCRIATRFDSASGYTNIENILPANSAQQAQTQRPTERLAQMAGDAVERAYQGRAQRPAREPVPAPVVTERYDCVDCGEKLYAGDDPERCPRCLAGRVPDAATDLDSLEVPF